MRTTCNLCEICGHHDAESVSIFGSKSLANKINQNDQESQPGQDPKAVALFLLAMIKTDSKRCKEIQEIQRSLDM